MGPVPVLNCGISSGRYICGILFINDPFLGVQHGRPEVILLLQYQSSPIQQSNAKFQFGIENMLLCLCQPHLLCPSQGQSLLEMGWWLSCYACVLPCSLAPILRIVDSFIYILAWADCPCYYTIVHFHWLDLGSKVNIWLPAFILKNLSILLISSSAE